MWIIFVFLFIFLMRLYFKLFKVPKLGSVTLVTGKVKAGKSTISVHLVLKAYKRALLSYHLRKFFSLKKTEVEKPLLYSNVPLGTDYVQLTEELVDRTKRFAYGSVIYVQEASLPFDSMSYDDEELNESLRIFNKLIAHETLGGQLFYDTQSVSDLHHQIKKNLGSYLYVDHNIKLPFFVVLYVRELMYSYDNSNVQNTVYRDVSSDLLRIVVPKSVWKKFDCYCYSAMTDNLPVETTVIHGAKLPNLKCSSYLKFGKKKSNETVYRRNYGKKIRKEA